MARGHGGRLSRLALEGVAVAPLRDALGLSRARFRYLTGRPSRVAVLGAIARLLSLWRRKVMRPLVALSLSPVFDPGLSGARTWATVRR